MMTISANNKIATACLVLTVGKVLSAEFSVNAISLRFYIKNLRRALSDFTHSKSYCVADFDLFNIS